MYLVLFSAFILLWGLLSFINAHIYAYHSSWEISGHYFLKYFPHSLQFFFWDLSCMHASHFDMIPQNPEALSLFSVFKFTDSLLSLILHFVNRIDSWDDLWDSWFKGSSCWFVSNLGLFIRRLLWRRCSLTLHFSLELQDPIFPHFLSSQKFQKASRFSFNRFSPETLTFQDCLIEF